MITLEEIEVRTNAIILHDRGFSGRGVTVALLDSGIDTSHSFFEGMDIETIDLTGEGLQDDFKHGTHCASILASISPGIKLISIKILDKEGLTNTELLMQGVKLAVEKGADIINLSVGEPFDGCPDDHPLGILVNSVTASGNVAVVTAAGNDKMPHVPASCLGAIAVGSCNKYGRTNVWSVKGPVCKDIYPDCVAYGEEVEGAVPNEGWEFVSGTSQATPQVSGMLALAKEATNLDFNRENMEILLSQSCTRVESPDKNNKSGWGVIDMDKFIRAIEVEQESLG